MGEVAEKTAEQKTVGALAGLLADGFQTQDLQDALEIGALYAAKKSELLTGSDRRAWLKKTMVEAVEVGDNLLGPLSAFMDTPWVDAVEAGVVATMADAVDRALTQAISWVVGDLQARGKLPV